jgi:hypothetical protein
MREKERWNRNSDAAFGTGRVLIESSHDPAPLKVKKVQTFGFQKKAHRA